MPSPADAVFAVLADARPRLVSAIARIVAAIPTDYVGRDLIDRDAIDRILQLPAR